MMEIQTTSDVPPTVNPGQTDGSAGEEAHLLPASAYEPALLSTQNYLPTQKRNSAMMEI